MKPGDYVWLPEVSPSGPVVVIVSIPDQELFVYRNGVRVRDIPLEDVGPAALTEGEFVWIGLHEPSMEILAHVQDRFGLHPLAVEDANRSHQRPKIDLYGEALFMVLRTAQVKDACIVFGETHVFAGRGYVIAVRHGPSASYGDVRQRCEREAQDHEIQYRNTQHRNTQHHRILHP
jgi:magnesium transporter